MRTPLQSRSNYRKVAVSLYIKIVGITMGLCRGTVRKRFADKMSTVVAEEVDPAYVDVLARCLSLPIAVRITSEVMPQTDRARAGERATESRRERQRDGRVLTHLAHSLGPRAAEGTGADGGGARCVTGMSRTGRRSWTTPHGAASTRRLSPARAVFSVSREVFCR
eukprot:COSAG02_NODE_3279_length_7026_cov_21.473798_8_plen_166_part_00